MSARPRKAILDTNLLLLWLVGQTDQSLLKSFKRVDTFSSSDVRRLKAIILPFRQLVTTPHILSETSNFIEQAPPWRRAALLAQFTVFVLNVAEVYQPAKSLVARGEFNALGITDTALAVLSADSVVVTVDHRLAGKIEALGGNALNFNRWRNMS